MGQIAHRGHTARGAVGVVVALAAVPLLSGCGSTLTHAATTLHGVLDVQVVHADGNVVPGVDGLRLRPGDVVRTGATGRAELHTRGRVVYEGSAAALQLVNGARDDLRHGAIVVDAQHGPGMTLTVAGLTSYTPGGAAARAERAATTRLAALAGNSSVDNDEGRHLDVAVLTQAVVGGDALPDSTARTPLHLTDDDGEARAVPTLVRDDIALDALASGIDSTGGAVAQLVSTRWRNPLQPLPSGAGRSEQVLPIVIAAAGGARDSDARYQDAVTLRAEGASWGVVARVLGVSSDAVLAALEVLERGAAHGEVGTVPAALDYLATHGGAATGTGPGTGPGNGPGSASSGGGGGAGSGSSGGGPSPQPSASPTSSPAPNPVSSAVGTVLSLLPTPLPTPTVTLPVQLPVPALPSVLPSVPTLPSLPLVGGTLGSVVTPVPLPTTLLH